MNCLIEVYRNDKKLFFLCFLTPLLFTLFFSQQVYLVFAHDLSVWKGGGMGMFSSPDHPSKRTVNYYITNQSGEEFRVIPYYAAAPDMYSNFEILPHPKYLQDIQETFMTSRWYVVDKSGSTLWVSDVPSRPNQPIINAASVRVEFWKMNDIDAAQNTYQYEKVYEWNTKAE